MSLGFSSNKGADQRAHWHRQISAFVICLLKNIILILPVSQVAIFLLVSVAEQYGFIIFRFVTEHCILPTCSGSFDKFNTIEHLS